MALTKVTRKTDTINVGWGRFNTLIDDLLSVANAKGASTIGIEDSAGNMAAANVEAALTEIYTDITSARALADIFDENSTTTTGQTWGYKGGTIRLDNTITTIAAGTTGLPNNDVSYIEVDSSGNVSDNTTGFTSGKIPIRQVTVSGGVQTVSTDKRAWFDISYQPTTNGQLIIGDTDDDPVLATITGTANEITVTNGAGSITLSIPSAAVITFANTGLHLLDTDASHDLIIKPGSDLSADRTLTVTTGNSNRTIILSGNPTLSDWFDQTVKEFDSGASPANIEEKGVTIAYHTSLTSVSSDTILSLSWDKDSICSLLIA